MIPAPTPVLIAELLPLVDMPVGTEVSDWGILPAVRVAKVSDLEASSRWEATPLFQVEIWSMDEATAEDAAYALKAAWPHYAAHRVHVPGIAPVVVHGRWVEVDPYPLPNPDDTNYYRQVLTLGIRYSGSTE